MEPSEDLNSFGETPAQFRHHDKNYQEPNPDDDEDMDMDENHDFDMDGGRRKRTKKSKKSLKQKNYHFDEDENDLGMDVGEPLGIPGTGEPSEGLNDLYVADLEGGARKRGHKKNLRNPNQNPDQIQKFQL